MTHRSHSDSPAEIAKRYVRVWNENDPVRRRTLIEQTFTPQASYIDPIMQSVGYDAMDAMIATAQSQSCGMHFSVSGRPDGHHDFVRFSWDLGPGNAESVAAGTDVAVMAADGRIEQVTGFIDKMPS